MKLGDLGGGHFFACRREADNVGEHDGEHTFFGAREPTRPFADKPRDQSAGDVASERAQAVEHGVERVARALLISRK